MADQPQNPTVFPNSAELYGGMTLRDYFAATLSFDPG